MPASELDPRTLISVDDDVIELSGSQDVEELQQRIQHAAAHSQFVRISAADGRDLRFLMSVERRVTITIVPPWLVGRQQQVPDIEGLDMRDL